MKNQLGTFEGTPIDIGALKLSGSASERVGRLDIGETIWIVGKAVVGKIEHGETKDGFQRNHKAEVIAMALIEHDDGERMLAEGQALADERFGLAGLFADRVVELRVNGETGEIEPDDEGDE